MLLLIGGRALYSYKLLSHINHLISHQACEEGRVSVSVQVGTTLKQNFSP